MLDYQLQLANQQTACTVAMARAQPLVNRRRRRMPQRKTLWIRLWLQRRIKLGHYSRLHQELRLEDEASFRNFLRMDPRMFHELLQRIEPRISRQDTWYRKALDPGVKPAITLRYLAKTCPCKILNILMVVKMTVSVQFLFYFIFFLFFFLIFAQNIDCGYTLEPPRTR